MQIRFHEAARDELRAAAQWYEAEREGLGEEFLSAVGQLIERAARGDLWVELNDEWRHPPTRESDAGLPRPLEERG